MFHADLHAHSTASDGLLAPAALVALAASRGVAVLALTDHDTLSGLPEAQAAAAAHGLRLVPGVEVSCDLRGRDVHILGLFVDPAALALVQLLEDARAERERAATRVLRRLADCRVPVTLEEVQAQAGGETLGRPHFARALVARGHVRSFNDAFDRYLGEGRPACVHRERPAIERACRAIREAGGLPVLAHPGAYGAAVMDREAISRLRLQGVAGLEVVHPSHDAEAVRRFRLIAQRLGLLVSGGSDTHGHADEAGPGHCGLDEAAFEALARRVAAGR